MVGRGTWEEDLLLVLFEELVVDDTVLIEDLEVLLMELVGADVNVVEAAIPSNGVAKTKVPSVPALAAIVVAMEAEFQLVISYRTFGQIHEVHSALVAGRWVFVIFRA